jgi:hypothetical protein
MSSQEVIVGCVHVLLSVVLQAFLFVVCLITYEHPRELILSCQQVLNADRCPRWRWWWIEMWNLATTSTSAGRPFGDAEHGILSGSGSHHLSRVTHIIRYCNNPIVYDVS